MQRISLAIKSGKYNQRNLQCHSDCGNVFIAGLVKKFGKRNVFSLGLILSAVGILVLEFGGSTMPVIVISSVIRGIGNACGGATIWAMVSDTIDYGEWKTGHRTEDW